MEADRSSMILRRLSACEHSGIFREKHDPLPHTLPQCSLSKSMVHRSTNLEGEQLLPSKARMTLFLQEKQTNKKSDAVRTGGEGD